MNERVRKVLEAVVDPEHLAMDDQGMYCPYCHSGCGWYDFGKQNSKYPHEASCPVVLARAILEDG